MEGTITRLERQKGSRDRVNVHLDGRFSFGLAYALAGRLRVGKYLTEEEVNSLVHEDGFRNAFDIALRFLAYRLRSWKEIDQHLQRKRVDSGARDAVLKRLADVGLVDDEAFARYWVDNREQFAPRSHRALTHELRVKGVSIEVIRLVLEDVDEEESAYRAAVAKVRKLGSIDGDALSEKVKGFLGRRGFSYSVVRTVVNRLSEEYRDWS